MAVRIAIPAAGAALMLLAGVALLPARGGEPSADSRAGQAEESRGVPTLAELAERATGADAEAAKAAVVRLRGAGPAGLAALLEANADAVALRRAGRAAGPGIGAGTGAGAGAGDWTRVSAAIDAVAAQKDAYASGLYWYTDLEAAKRAAKASGKPILSLRLLGTLDSEYSCANSRFFRTVLYANQEVSKTLSERFVLHWKSVRPVPRITIDFGDGRVVERTITGNSIHYVLDADGDVIDAVPGLYGPKAFLKQVTDAAAMAKSAEPMDRAGRAAALREWHALRAREDLAQWQRDLATAGVPLGEVSQVSQVSQVSTVSTAQPILAQPAAPAPAAPPGAANPPAALAAAPLASAKRAVERPMVVALAAPAAGPGAANAGAANAGAANAGAANAGAAPPAVAAAPRAMGKFAVEGPMVRAIAAAPAPAAGWVLTDAGNSAAKAPLLEAATDDAAWARVAALHAEDAKLDAGSRGLMAAKNPDALRAGRAALAKSIVESPMVRLVRNFERSVAEDTVRNEYTFHRQIHQWLADGKTADGKPVDDVDRLNEQVYAQLFLTPSSDPWLGLVPPDTYTALPDEGICKK